MEITSEILRNAYGENDVIAIYQTVMSENDFLGFAKRFMHDEDYRVARIALWTLTKATDEELSALQVIYNELIDLAMTTENSAVRRLSLNIVERLKMNEDEMRTDFLDFCLEHMVDIEEFPGTQTLCTTYQGIRPAEKMLVKLQMKAITFRYFSSRRLIA